MTGQAQGTQGYLDVDGGKIYYEVMGQGHPLVLIHAGVADCTMWDEQIGPFSRRYRVIRYDTRGYGRTTTEDVAYSNRQDLYDLLKHLGVEKTYVLGISRGGQIAIDFTLEHPDMVDALVPVNAGLGGYEAKIGDDLMKVFNEMEEAYEKGDFQRAIDLEVQMWLAGPNRSVDELDPA